MAIEASFGRERSIARIADEAPFSVTRVHVLYSVKGEILGLEEKCQYSFFACITNPLRDVDVIAIAATIVRCLACYEA